MARTEANIKIGPVAVTYKGVELGHTEGDVTFSYTPEYVDIVANEFGNTPIDKALLGEDVRIVCPLAEKTRDNLAAVIPLGTTEDSGGDEELEFGSDASQLIGTTAGELVLHPLKNDVSDLSEDITLYKAVVDEAVELTQSPDAETVLEVTFVALLDTSKPDGNRLGHYGSHIS